jgi:hypothetical protein
MPPPDACPPAALLRSASLQIFKGTFGVARPKKKNVPVNPYLLPPQPKELPLPPHPQGAAAALPPFASLA